VIDAVAPEPILDYIKKTQDNIYLLLHFNETVTGEVLGNIDFSIEGLEQYDWNIEAAPEESSKHNPYTITIEPTETVVKGTNAKVTFKKPSLIKDKRGNILGEDSATTELPDFAYEAAESTEAAAQKATLSAIGALAAVAGASAAMGFGSFGAVWALLEALQIIHFFTFMTIAFPETLRGFFRAMSFANFQMLPNAFKLFIINSDTFEEPPHQFRAEEMDTDYLLNIGSVFLMWFILLLLFPIAYSLKTALPKNLCTRKFWGLFVFSTWFRMGIESFLMFTLAIFLQFRDLDTSGGMAVFSVILCFITVTYQVFVMGLVVLKVTI
jgi:hypothetical protein